jgi:hypothetical protein
MVREYKIIAKECVTKDGKKKFFAFSIIHPESKKRIDFRFKLTAVNKHLIEKAGHHLVMIDDTAISYTESYEYPRIYCDDIVGVVEDRPLENVDNTEDMLPF